jgi:hypothetical protein
MKAAHETQKKGDVKDLIDKEQQIKEEYPTRRREKRLSELKKQ